MLHLMRRVVPCALQNSTHAPMHRLPRLAVAFTAAKGAAKRCSQVQACQAAHAQLGSKLWATAMVQRNMRAYSTGSGSYQNGTASQAGMQLGAAQHASHDSRQDEEADDHGLKSKEVEEEEEYDEDGEDDDDGYGDCDDDTPSPAEVERQEKVAAGVALAAVGMQASVAQQAEGLMKQGVPLPRDARRHALGWYEIAHMYKGIAEFSMRSEAAAYVNGGEAARAVQSYTFLREREAAGSTHHAAMCYGLALALLLRDKQGDVAVALKHLEEAETALCAWAQALLAYSGRSSGSSGSSGSSPAPLFPPVLDAAPAYVAVPRPPYSMNLPFGDMPAADEGTEAGSTGDTAGEQTSHVTTRETVLRDAMCDAAELAVRPPTSHLLHSTWPRLRLALAIARATAASRTSDWQAVLQYARTAAELAGGLYGQGSLPELNARHAESVALCGLKRWAEAEAVSTRVLDGCCARLTASHPASLEAGLVMADAVNAVRGAQNSKVAASYEQLAVRCVSSRFTYRFLAAAHEAYTAWQSKCDAAATHADTQLVWPDAGSDANPRSGSPSSSAAAAAGGGSSDGSSAAANGSSAGGIFGVRPHRQPQPPLSARLFALSDPDRLAARLQALEEVLADRTRTARAAREKLRARPQEIEREMKGLEEEAKGKGEAASDEWATEHKALKPELDSLRKPGADAWEPAPLPLHVPFMNQEDWEPLWGVLPEEPREA